MYPPAFRAQKLQESTPMPLILAGDKPLARSFATRRKGRPDQDYFAQVWLRQVPDAENVTNPSSCACPSLRSDSPRPLPPTRPVRASADPTGRGGGRPGPVGRGGPSDSVGRDAGASGR